jgi:hypothetical protein
MFVSGWLLLENLSCNFWTAPSSTFAVPGVNTSEMSLATATFADPDFVASAALVAVICTDAFAGKSDGAV